MYNAAGTMRIVPVLVCDWWWWSCAKLYEERS